VARPLGLPHTQAQACGLEDALNLRPLERGSGSALQPVRDVAVAMAS